MDDYIEIDYETITNVEKRKLLQMMNSSIINGFTQEDYDDVLAVLDRVVKRIESCGAKMITEEEHDA